MSKQNYKQITFNQEEKKEFMVLYVKAVEAEKESFFYRGDEFDTGYAGYVIEYLNMVKK